MCFWHFLSNILQEHTQPLLTGLATSFHDTNPTAHSLHIHKKCMYLNSAMYIRDHFTNLQDSYVLLQANTDE